MPLIIDVEGAGQLALDVTRENRILEINPSVTLQIFRERSIRSNALVSNFFNLFQLINVGSDGKFKYARMSRPKHVLSSRRKGCTWSPKSCGVKLSEGEVETCPIEFQNETCPDFAWNSCWEKIMGVGLDKKDFYATAEGEAILAQLVEGTFEGVGNSIHDLLWHGHHPIIEEANETKSYRNAGIDDDEWDCYYDQQKACGGILTLVDYMKSQGVKNFDVEINESDVSGVDYVGSATTLFDRLISKMPKNMKLLSKRASSADGKPIILVSASIFARYENELRENFSNIDAGYYLTIDGSNSRCMNCPPGIAAGVLKYKGFWVVCMDEWDSLGDMTSTYTHRAMVVVPQIFVVASDVTLQPYSGMGMEINQKLLAPDNGKVFMNALFEMGVGILDPEYIVNACRTETLTDKDFS